MILKVQKKKCQNGYKIVPGEDYYHWGIVYKEDGNLIGTTNLKIDEDNIRPRFEEYRKDRK